MSDPVTTRLPPTPCRTCGRSLDSALDPHRDHRPKPGDISVCVYCSTLSVFAGDLTLRPPTAAEWDAVFDHKDVEPILTTLQRAKARRPPPSGD